MGEEGESTDVLAGADPQLRAAVEEASGLPGCWMLLCGCCACLLHGCCMPRCSKVAGP